MHYTEFQKKKKQSRKKDKHIKPVMNADLQVSTLVPIVQDLELYFPKNRDETLMRDSEFQPENIILNQKLIQDSVVAGQALGIRSIVVAGEPLLTKKTLAT